jgi:hypothetical protein
MQINKQTGIDINCQLFIQNMKEENGPNAGNRPAYAVRRGSLRR